MVVTTRSKRKLADSNLQSEMELDPDNKNEFIGYSFENMIPEARRQDAFDAVMKLPPEKCPRNARGKCIRMNRSTYYAGRDYLTMKPKLIQKFLSYWDSLRRITKEKIAERHNWSGGDDMSMSSVSVSTAFSQSNDFFGDMAWSFDNQFGWNQVQSRIEAHDSHIILLVLFICKEPQCPMPWKTNLKKLMRNRPDLFLENEIKYFDLTAEPESEDNYHSYKEEEEIKSEYFSECVQKLRGKIKLAYEKLEEQSMLDEKWQLRMRMKEYLFVQRMIADVCELCQKRSKRDKLVK